MCLLQLRELSIELVTWIGVKHGKLAWAANSETFEYDGCEICKGTLPAGEPPSMMRTRGEKRE